MLTLSPEAQSRVNLARMQGRKYGYKAINTENKAARCPNCFDAQIIIVQVEDPSSTSLTYFEGDKFSTHVKTECYPCPVCDSRDHMIEHLWRNSGIDDHERGYRLDFLRGKAGKGDAVNAATAILSDIPNPTGWLTLWGSYGVGKTGLAKGLVCSMIVAGVPAQYTRADDILADIRASYGDKNAASEREIESRVGWAKCLVIDEVDRVSGTEWAKATLFRLLDTRYKRRQILATVLISNKSPADLPDMFRYLSSRMADGALVVMAGESLRG